MIDPQGGEGIAPPPCLSYEQIFLTISNVASRNKIFPVTGESGKNIDNMFPVSEKDDKMFPDSDRGKEKWLKSAVGSLD